MSTDSYHTAYPPELVDHYQLNRVIRHRLRNLCAGVKMTVSRMAERAAETLPDITERCAVIEAEIDNLQMFTRRMDLIFDRLPVPEPLDFFDVLIAARDNFIRRFALCELEFDGPELALRLKSGSLWELAIDELLTNAGEAAGLDGQVRLAWAMDGERLRVEIINTGGQIAENVPLSPPKPFYTTRGRHDGLGLAIARRVALACGGDFDVHNAPDGRVTAKLTIPSEELLDER